MDDQKDKNCDWIGPLVTKLNLVKEKEPVVDINRFRGQLEDCQLVERMRKTVSGINGAVGYQALHLLDFLPPQRSVVRLSFSNKKTEYILEIVVRSTGAAVVFHSVNKVPDAWARYLHVYSRSLGSRIAFNQNFDPAEITDEIVQTWFSFLLSGFNKKFNPGAHRRSSEGLDFDLGGFLDKASA